MSFSSLSHSLPLFLYYFFYILATDYVVFQSGTLEWFVEENGSAGGWTMCKKAHGPKTRGNGVKKGEAYVQPIIVTHNSTSKADWTLGNDVIKHGKTAGWIGFGSDQSGHWSKRVTGQSGCGSNGSWVKSGCELGRVDPYFSNFFFFWSRCNLSIVYEFLNYN